MSISDLNLKSIVIILAIIIAVVAGIWFLSTLNAQNTMPGNGDALVTNDVVATVNGESILRVDMEALQTQIAAQQGVDIAALDAQTQEAIKTQATESLIAQALLQQAVANANIEVSDADVEMQLTQIAGSFENEAAMQAALAAEGLTKETLQEQIKKDLATQTYLNTTLDLESLTVSEEDVTEAYTQVSAQGEVPPLEEVRAQVEALVLQQKQQDLIVAHIDSLRVGAKIEHL